MITFRHRRQLAIPVLFLSLINTALATELTKNENKDNRISDPIGNANLDDNTGRYSEPALTVTNNDKITDSNQQRYQVIEERRRKLQQAQLEAYKRHLQKRNEQMSANPNLPEEFKIRQQEYFKYMEARRELINKMMEQQRKQANERRNSFQQQMYKTDARQIKRSEMKDDTAV